MVPPPPSAEDVLPALLDGWEGARGVQEPGGLHRVGGVGGSSAPKCQRETSSQQIET